MKNKDIIKGVREVLLARIELAKKKIDSYSNEESIKIASCRGAINEAELLLNLINRLQS